MKITIKRIRAGFYEGQRIDGNKFEIQDLENGEWGLYTVKENGHQECIYNYSTLKAAKTAASEAGECWWE